MKWRLYYQNPARRVQYFFDFFKEFTFLLNFMSHIEEQYKINRFCYTNSVFTALVQNDPIFKRSSSDLGFYLIQHPLLQICCNYSTIIPNQFRHIN